MCSVAELCSTIGVTGQMRVIHVFQIETKKLFKNKIILYRKELQL